MKTKHIKPAIFVVMAISCSAIQAQNSFPAPGTGSMPGGGTSLPAPGTGSGFNPGPGIGGGAPWGSPWYGSVVGNVPLNQPDWQNQGLIHVVGCGYDSQGVWRVVPMVVAYEYNGIQYDVNVLNAWNPWTDTWDRDVDAQAFNTDYWLRGTEFDFYTVLPYGTFYFNL